MPSTFNLSEPKTFTLENATVNDIQQAFEFGALSAEELVQLYLNRIAAYDDSGPGINSVISVNPNALETARELDENLRSGDVDGDLYGIPVLLKDNYDTFDLPTTAGSDVLAGSIPPDDAFTVEQFREEGAIILGKTNMSEFALSSGRLGYSSLGGLTINPYNLDRDASGSSSGTGAAIAANFAVLGTGTDTAGSVRGPASATGLVGIKPTRGLVSNDGIIPLALTADVAGPMAKTVTDAAIALGVMAGVDPNDPATLASTDNTYEDYTQFLDPNALEGARIGVARDYFGGNEEVDSLVEAAIAQMESLGATIVELELPEAIVEASNYGTLLNTVVQAEFNPQIEEYFATLDEEYPDDLAELIAASQDPELVDSETPVNPNRIAVYEDSLDFGGLDNPEYIAAIEEGIPTLQNNLDRVFEDNDLDTIVYPTIATPPTPITTDDGTPIDDPTYEANLDNVGGDPYRANYLANLSGFPDLTVPVGYTEQNLPVGISFLGQEFSEPTLIGLAYDYEQEAQVRVAPANTTALPGEEFEYSTEVLVIGDLGDDELIAGILPDFDGNKDFVFGGEGDDFIDTTESITGGSRLYGGNGDDILLSGLGDRAVGGEGDDALFAGRGDNTLTGGVGEDSFWITTAELPQKVNTITDFEAEVDVIGVGGLGIAYEDLDFRVEDSNTIVSALGQDLAILLNIEQVEASNFVFA